MFLRAFAAACLAAWMAATPARADWVRVEGDRFIVYGDGAVDTVRKYAVKLDTYDRILRLYNPAAGTRPPRKLEIYLVRGKDDLRRVSPGIDSRVGGFYRAGPMGVFAIAPMRSDALGQDDILFHEYAHHFMLENFPAAYPAWFIEGWAEYFAPTDITPQGVKVGGYNVNRAYWLFNAAWVPLEDLLAKSPWQIERSKRHLYYSQAWLLTHYMQADRQRADQLNRATRAIAAGEAPVKAFQAATGMDPPALTKALRGYRKLPVTTFKDLAGQAPELSVSTLEPAAEALLLDRLRLAGVHPGARDEAYLSEIRRRAARFPGQRFADLVLAQAEFTLGDTAAGEAIVARRLKAKADDVEFLSLAGFGQLFAGEREPARRVERFKAARAFFGKAYALDKTDYRNLYAYAFSRTVEPAFPTDNDLNAILEARALAPSVQESSLLAGAALLKRNRREEALKVLAPVANNPHGGPMAARARALMAGKSEAEADAEAAGAETEPTGGEPTDALR